MKYLIVLLISLFTVNGFADNWDNISIDDIYDRGYKIEATVIQDPGLIIPDAFTFLDIGPEVRAGFSACRILLKDYDGRRSRILKKGRVISFVSRPKYENVFGTSWNSDEDQTVYSFHIPQQYIEEAPFGFRSLQNLRKSCGHGVFSFQVVPQDSADFEEANLRDHMQSTESTVAI